MKLDRLSALIFTGVVFLCGSAAWSETGGRARAAVWTVRAGEGVVPVKLLSGGRAFGSYESYRPARLPPARPLIYGPAFAGGWYGPGFYGRGYLGPGLFRPAFYGFGWGNPGFYRPGFYGPGFFGPGYLGSGFYGPGLFRPGWYGPYLNAPAWNGPGWNGDPWSTPAPEEFSPDPEWNGENSGPENIEGDREPNVVAPPADVQPRVIPPPN